jgi:hypothetical protein
MTAADQALASFFPRPAWRSALAPALDTLLAQPEHVPSWATVAMVLGDAGAPALCFLVCAHARTLPRQPAEDQRLSAHQALAAADLGLARAGIPAWLERELAPFDGVLARAAIFALLLAGARVGLLAGPDPPTVSDLINPDRWKPAP